MIYLSKLKSTACIALTTLCLTLVTSCQQPEQSVQTPLPPAGCELAWADSLAVDFVNHLEAATEKAHAVWPNYNLGDGAVILDAGLNCDSTSHCLGLWQHGDVKEYIESPEAPKLATVLYGYQLNFKELVKEDGLVERSQQPAPITNLLNRHGLETAVIMPVDFPQFPFEIPALKKMQIAIHESFHVEVMLRYWYSGEGEWPAWDEQPDRNASRQCYALNDEVVATFNSEKDELISMIEALLDADKNKAIETGTAFLATRNNRYEQLNDFTINRQDSTQCDCAEAENMMELEEGLADYASWTMLYEIGVSSREELINRYRAIQQEPFYLTGAMLMHAISLMNPEGKEAVINTIIQAPDHEAGALIIQFKSAFENYKNQ